MKMSWKESKGKVVICKDGVYFALDKEQLNVLQLILNDIHSNEKKYYKEDNRG